MRERNDRAESCARSSSGKPAAWHAHWPRGTTWWGRPLPHVVELPEDEAIEEYPGGPRTRLVVAHGEPDPWWTDDRCVELRVWIESLFPIVQALVRGGDHLTRYAEARTRARILAERWRSGGVNFADTAKISGEDRVRCDRALVALVALRSSLPIDGGVRGVLADDQALRRIATSGLVESHIARRFHELAPKPSGSTNGPDPHQHKA